MPTVARIAPSSCSCGWNGQMYFSERAGWTDVCPGCGKSIRYGGHNAPRETKRFYGNRRFAGSESVSQREGFHPSEVAFARKHITAGTISDEGDVSFTDRQDQRKFVKQRDRLIEGLRTGEIVNPVPSMPRGAIL